MNWPASRIFSKELSPISETLTLRTKCHYCGIPMEVPHSTNIDEHKCNLCGEIFYVMEVRIGLNIFGLSMPRDFEIQVNKAGISYRQYAAWLINQKKSKQHLKTA